MSPVSTIKVTGLSAAALSLLGALSFNATAVELKADTQVKLRQGFMQTQKLQLASLTEVSKGKAEFNDEAVQRAENMKNLAKIIPDAFRTPSHVDLIEGTNALPKIWEQPEEIKKLITRLQKETSRLADIAQERNVDSLTAQLKRVGNVCKSCHDEFKKAQKK